MCVSGGVVTTERTRRAENPPRAGPTEPTETIGWIETFRVGNGDKQGTGAIRTPSSSRGRRDTRRFEQRCSRCGRLIHGENLRKGLCLECDRGPLLLRADHNFQRTSQLQSRNNGIATAIRDGERGGGKTSRNVVDRSTEAGTAPRLPDGPIEQSVSPADPENSTIPPFPAEPIPQDGGGA